MEQKPISEMSTKEIFRKQLELLAEYSETTASPNCDWVIFSIILSRLTLSPNTFSKYISITS